MAYREIDCWNAGFTVYVPHDWMDEQITLRRHWICPHSVCIWYIWLSQ